MFAVIGAMAEFERSLIQERVKAGLRNAQAKGQQLGRPQRVVSSEAILQMKAEGFSLRQIAERIGIGYGTVRARLAGERKTL
jgi:DNA invertase Pin-like site-specific DNA recombinase